MRCDACDRVTDDLVAVAGMRVCATRRRCRRTALDLPAEKWPMACRWCAHEIVPALVRVQCGPRFEWECIDAVACGRRTRVRYGMAAQLVEQLRLF
jgi:hypothetical protein